MRNRKRWIVLVASSLLVSSATLSVWAGEGFGMAKKTVRLERLRPAEILIMGTRIALRTSGHQQYEVLEQRLASSLTSELLGNDPRLSLAVDHPETVIEVNVLDSSFSERWESRKVSRVVRSGDRYVSRIVAVRFKIVSQTLSVAYSVSDRLVASTIMADNVNYQWSEEYEDGNGAPDRSTLLSSALLAVMQTIARRVTPTSEWIEVMVPKGSLKRYVKLAEAGLWNRYLEALEGLPRNPDSNDESYRQYGLGLAYEALGYQANDSSTTLRYMDQAAQYYDAAISANPKEEYFTGSFRGSGVVASLKQRWLGGSGERKEALAPVERVRTAMAQYQRSLDFDHVLEEVVELSASGGEKAIERRGFQVVTNSSVIEMTAAGLSDTIIFAAIDNATKTVFDVSPQGLVELARANVPSRVIEHLQEVSVTLVPDNRP